MEKQSGLAVASISLLSMVPLAPVPYGAGLQIPINFSSPNSSFAGVFELSRFAVRDDQLVAAGTLSGTVTDSAGQTVGAVARTLMLPVINVTGRSDILHLEVGPINLSLLRLMVHVGQIFIDIDARSGPEVCSGACSTTAAADAARQPT
jgi:hypothetical protein